MGELEVLYGIKAEITKKVGNGISGRVHFKATSPKEIDNKMLWNIQTKLGYHPYGYGFFFQTHSFVNGSYIYILGNVALVATKI